MFDYPFRGCNLFRRVYVQLHSTVYSGTVLPPLLNSSELQRDQWVRIGNCYLPSSWRPFVPRYGIKGSIYHVTVATCPFSRSLKRLIGRWLFAVETTTTTTTVAISHMCSRSYNWGLNCTMNVNCREGRYVDLKGCVEQELSLFWGPPFSIMIASVQILLLQIRRYVNNNCCLRNLFSHGFDWLDTAETIRINWYK